ncbi:MAG: hypothetical protein ABL882_03895 [Sphingopyxis sp.]
MRVFEKLHCGSIRTVKIAQWTTAIGHLCAHFSFLNFKRAQPLFICSDQSWRICIHDAIYQCCHLAIDARSLRNEVSAAAFRRFQTGIPEIAEQFGRELIQLWRRTKLFEEVSKFTFHRIAADRFALRWASARLADVVREFLVTPLRPAGRDGIAAIGAFDETAQRKIHAGIYARQ